MDNEKGFFGKLFSEDSGISSMRLFFICAFFMFYPAFAAVWTFTSIQGKALQDIPQGVIWLIGTLLMGKLLQKGIEKEKG